MAEETKNDAKALADDLMKKARAAELEALELANKRLNELEKALKAAEARADQAERKLKASKVAAPTGDVVHLGGKSWQIRGTVKAQNALEEVKRGHIPEDASLIITDRTE